VLEDCEFVNASIDVIERNVGPKVQGSILLDELSGPNVDLDFFILFGSMMGITGNWSQSAYSAATCFQASLIHRRRARGLVGSIIHLGLINGIGIISRKGSGYINYVKNTTGSYLLSERDVDKFFAEAIFAGHPQSGRNAELMNGNAMVDPDEYAEVAWIEKPLLWNMIRYHAKSNSERSGTTQGPSSVKAQFELATNIDDVSEIIEASLTAKVRSKFSIDADVPITASTRLQALGMDSLVAVDLRSWIAKEMGVDIPLLEILSGGSIRQLTTEISSLLPPTLIPNVSEAVNLENNE
jgi:acyl carrier protein